MNEFKRILLLKSHQHHLLVILSSSPLPTSTTWGERQPFTLSWVEREEVEESGLHAPRLLEKKYNEVNPLGETEGLLKRERDKSWWDAYAEICTRRRRREIKKMTYFPFYSTRLSLLGQGCELVEMDVFLYFFWGGGGV